MNKQKTIMVAAGLASLLLIAIGTLIVVNSRSNGNNGTAVVATEENFDKLPDNTKEACQYIDSEAVVAALGADFAAGANDPARQEGITQVSDCTFTRDTATATITVESFPDVERANSELRNRSDVENPAIQPQNEYGSFAFFVTNEPGKNYSLHFQQNNHLINVTLDAYGDEATSLEKAKEVGGLVKTL